MLHKFVYYHCSGTMLVFSSFFILILLYVLPKQRPNFFFLRGCLESNTPWFKVVQGTYERAIAQGGPMNPLLKIIILGIFSTELSDYKNIIYFIIDDFFLSLRIVWWNNRVEENVDVLNGISCVNRFSYYIWGISPLLTKLILINWFLET